MTTTERGLRWHAIAGLALPLMGLISSIRVRGEDNVPATGPFIVAPCHFSAIDPVVMGVGVWKAGRVPRFMAKVSLFKLPILGSILRSAPEPEHRARISEQEDQISRQCCKKQRLWSDLGGEVYRNCCYWGDQESQDCRGKPCGLRTLRFGEPGAK